MRDSDARKILYLNETAGKFNRCPGLVARPHPSPKEGLRGQPTGAGARGQETASGVMRAAGLCVEAFSEGIEEGTAPILRSPTLRTTARVPHAGIGEAAGEPAAVAGPVVFAGAK